jgi:hypothetical protein
MNVREFIRYLFLAHRTKPRRYRSLFRTIRRNACRNIVEIGVYDGRHALQMIQTALISYSKDDVRYCGFDLFEDLDEDLLRQESSKQPLSCGAVRSKLESTGANIRLFKGNTKTSLPRHIDDIGEADFIFVDGGHSEETIESDWSNVKKLMGKDTIVIFDDYYVDRSPEMEGFGCNAIVDGLDSEIYEVEIMEPMDVFRKSWGSLKIKMARIRKRGRRRS